MITFEPCLIYYLEEMQHLEPESGLGPQPAPPGPEPYPNHHQSLGLLRRQEDHFASRLPSHTSQSCYQASFSPSRDQDYNRREIEQGLRRFRKEQNSNSQLLPSISKVQDRSQYQQSYLGVSRGVIQRGKQNSSYFLKQGWALEPRSNYQKDFRGNDSAQWNKDNGSRVDHSHLLPFQGREGPRNSNYRADFKVHTIVKESTLSIADKDHLLSLDKGHITAETNVSQYQRRYDRVMRQARGEDVLDHFCKKAKHIN